MSQKPEPLAYTLEDGVAAAGVTRTRAYQDIAAGNLKSFKVGRRRMVTVKSLREYVAWLEAQSSARAAA